jgi:hypothetical protein
VESPVDLKAVGAGLQEEEIAGRAGLLRPGQQCVQSETIPRFQVARIVGRGALKDGGGEGVGVAVQADDTPVVGWFGRAVDLGRQRLAGTLLLEAGSFLFDGDFQVIRFMVKATGAGDRMG